MIISSTAIIISVAVVVLSLTATLMNPFTREFLFLKSKEGKTYDNDEEGACPSVSIVIAADSSTGYLKEQLPLLLSQKYEGEHEIIVVTEKGDTQTEDILKRYKDNPNIYTTFIPDSSRYMSKKKLAIMLGVKAAKHDWVLITDADVIPTSENWLDKYSRKANGSADVILSYTALPDEMSAFCRFRHLQTALYYIYRSQHNNSYRTNSSCILMKKEVFLNGEGFRGNLEQTRGEYDFIANKYALEGKSDIFLDQEAFTINNAFIYENVEGDVVAHKDAWHTSLLYALHAHKLLQRKLSTDILKFADNTLLYLSILLILLTLLMGISILTANTAQGLILECASILTTLFPGTLDGWMLLTVSVLFLLLQYIVDSKIVQSIARRFGEEISVWKFFPFQLSTVWHGLFIRMKYKKTDKSDFTTHKL